jgi:rubrerythrin
MKKTKLIEALKYAIKEEEFVVSVYLNHLNAIVNRFDVDEDYILAAKNIINKLILGDQSHKKKCEVLLQEIENSEKEDY